MNIFKGLLFLQKSSIIDVQLGYIKPSENIEIFKEKIIAIVTTHSVFLL